MTMTIDWRDYIIGIFTGWFAHIFLFEVLPDGIDGLFEYMIAGAFIVLTLYFMFLLYFTFRKPSM